MTEILSFFFIVGAMFIDGLEAWILVLIGLIVACNFLLGIRYKPLAILGFFEAASLAGGYLWASQVAQQQDVSGPYAWALVVGFWLVFAFLANTTTFVVWFIQFRRTA